MAAKQIGPFPGNVKPVRSGMYKRRTLKGNIVWSYFQTGVTRSSGWCKFSASYAKAQAKGYEGSRSKHQSLPWFALDAAK